jgi:hypothetical protein
MASAAESELAALFVTAREMIPHRQILIAMGWPQAKTPIQTDNSTAVGVTNKTIVPRRAKVMDMHYGGFDAANLKTSFVTTGMLAPKTGLIITPNIPQTPTMKPTDPLMRASGNRLAPKSTAIFAKPLALWFLLQVFPFYFYFFLSTEHYFSHIMNVTARVCRSPYSWLWTDHSKISLTHLPTPPKCSVRAIMALINNLGIVYHQYCSSSHYSP